MSLKLEAKDLPCIFASLAEDYPESNLIKCSGETERKRLKLSNYDELQVLDPFEKTFVDFGTQVEKTFVDFGTQVEKIFVDFGTQVEKKTFVDFGTQVEKKTFVDFGTQVENFSVDFEAQVSFLDLTYEIFLRRIKELEDLNKQLSTENSMRNEIYKELTNYLTTILEELCVEKNQETNEIDELARLQSQMGCIKKCPVCKVSNIDNK
ncbi:6183_t:CDS:2, partial [Cetraspora pellucida]